MLRLAWQVRLLVDWLGSYRVAPSLRRRVRRVAEAHREALGKYAVPTVAGPVLVVLSEQYAAQGTDEWYERWRPYVRGELRVEIVPEREVRTDVTGYPDVVVAAEDGPRLYVDRKLCRS